MNGRALERRPLGTAWEEIRFHVPAVLQVPGENWICLRFDRGAPGPDGPGVAATVSLLNLP